MNFDSFRKFCLSLPHATEDVQWGDDLLFRIAGKIFASYNLNPASGHRVAFKCTPERAAELLEIEGAERAPYVGPLWVDFFESTRRAFLSRVEAIPAIVVRDDCSQSAQKASCARSFAQKNA